MLVAAFASRRAYAAVFLVGLFAVSAPFTAALSMTSRYDWVSALPR